MSHYNFPSGQHPRVTGAFIFYISESKDTNTLVNPSLFFKYFIEMKVLVLHVAFLLLAISGTNASNMLVGYFAGTNASTPQAAVSEVAPVILT